MPVEQHGRSARRRGDLADDHGSGALELEGAEALDAGPPQEGEHGLVRLEKCWPRVRGKAPLGDERNRDEPREILLQLGHQRRNRSPRESSLLTVALLG